MNARRIILDQLADKDEVATNIATLDTMEEWVRSFATSNDLFSFQDEKPVNESYKEIQRNFDSKITHAGFIHYLHLCWAKEIGAEIRPDMIWYTIVSELAAMILKSPEDYKHLFTDTQAKKNITVVTGSILIDVEVLIDAMRNVIRDPEFLSDVCDVEFPSAAKNASYALKMAFASAATPYFNYFSTLCGIPHLELSGSIEEWKHLHNAIGRLSKYVPAFSEEKRHKETKIDPYLRYISQCQVTVQEIIDCGFESSNSSFFSEIFHYGKNSKCGSGHPDHVVRGWAKNFYILKDEADLSEFPAHVNYVPYESVETGKTFVQVATLSHSEKDEANNTLRPQYGIITYEVTDDEASNKMINPERVDSRGRKYQPLSKKSLVAILKGGRYYNPASVHYGKLEGGGIQCDHCREYDINECVGHDKHDLCMKCVEILKDQYKLKDITFDTDMTKIVKKDAHGVEYITITPQETLDILKKGKHVIPFCYACRTYNINEYYVHNGKGLCMECVGVLKESLENAGLTIGDIK